MAYSTTGVALDFSAGLLIGLGLSGASFGVVLVDPRQLLRLPALYKEKGALGPSS